MMFPAEILNLILGMAHAGPVFAQMGPKTGTFKTFTDFF